MRWNAKMSRSARQGQPDTSREDEMRCWDVHSFRQQNVGLTGPLMIQRRPDAAVNKSVQEPLNAGVSKDAHHGQSDAGRQNGTVWGVCNAACMRIAIINTFLKDLPKKLFVLEREVGVNSGEESWRIAQSVNAIDPSQPPESLAIGNMTWYACT